MIIVLEGCDAVGKSTFAEKLAEKTGYEILKGSSFQISELGASGMFGHMMELLERDNIIIDRFFYSNLVYGKLFNYPMMTNDQYDELVALMDERALLIYLHAPEGIIKHRLYSRGDDMIKGKNIKSILNEYTDVLNGDFRPKMQLTIDTTTSDFNIATAMIKEIINQDMVKTYIKNS